MNSSAIVSSSGESDARAQKREELRQKLSSGSFQSLFAVQGADAASAPEAELETPATAVEKKSFDVVLTAIDSSKKLNIIKEIRSIFSIGLKDAKDLVEKPPAVLKKDVPAAAVEALKERLIALGCTVELK